MVAHTFNLRAHQKAEAGRWVSVKERTNVPTNEVAFLCLAAPYKQTNLLLVC